MPHRHTLRCSVEFESLSSRAAASTLPQFESAGDHNCGYRCWEEWTLVVIRSRGHRRTVVRRDDGIQRYRDNVDEDEDSQKAEPAKERVKKDSRRGKSTLDGQRRQLTGNNAKPRPKAKDGMSSPKSSTTPQRAIYLKRQRLGLSSRTSVSNILAIDPGFHEEKPAGIATHQRVQRLHEHSLRVARRPDRLQLAFANPVIHRPPRHAEELGRRVDHHRLKHAPSVARPMPAPAHPTTAAVVRPWKEQSYGAREAATRRVDRSRVAEMISPPATYSKNPS